MASAAMKSYFPDRLDAANFLSLFQKVFVICNSKNQCNSSDLLGNAALPEDNKPGFLSQFAVWVESWSECIWSVNIKVSNFTLIKQICHAPITTLERTSSSLIREFDQDY